MKRPNITPGKWQRNGTTVFALTPYRGDSPQMARRCPDGINKFSTRVSGDNSVKSGGADDEELEANARAIAALPELLAALEALHAVGKKGVAMRHETGKPTWSALEETKKLTQAALTQAGYTFD